MVRLDSEVLTIDIVVKLPHTRDSGKSFFFQLLVVFLCKVQSPGSVSNRSLLSVFHHVGEDSSDTIL